MDGMTAFVGKFLLREREREREGGGGRELAYYRHTHY